MFEKYILTLFKQYCETVGIEFKSVYTHREYYNFVEWIAKNKLLLEEYQDYLQYVGIDICGSCEVGKGRYDSLATQDIEIISEYGDTLGRTNADFIVENGIAYSVSSSGIYIPESNLILTHNPYELSSIFKWKDLHNSGTNINIGMYGLLTDKNFLNKIRAIESLIKNMLDDYQIYYDTDNNKYFLSLSSKRKVKRKKLVK